MRTLKMLGALGVALLVLGLLAGCGGKDAAAADSDAGDAAEFEMASLAGMPEQVQQAPVLVRESYQFAIANPDILQEVPCYCGCGAMGHTSNYSCYAEGTEADDTLRFDGHALGCSICVDITQDTMRLLEEGKSVAEIQTYVDGRYSKYGPPTP